MHKLTKKQQEMMDWFDNNHSLIIGDRNRVYTTGSRIYVGMRNTLLSLERLGLVKTDVRRTLRIYEKTPADELPIEEE